MASLEPTQGEEAGHLLRSLRGAHLEVVELLKWDNQIQYCAELLEAMPGPKIPVVESLGRVGPFIALRHDVDHSLQNALAMARTEYLRGHRATYYLLPPDGFNTNVNYFGWLDGRKLVFRSDLIDAAKYLVELGHEVALHNDVITLALYLRRNPVELLREQLDFFRQRGVPVHGTSSHGSSLCAPHGYINSQIFRGLSRNPPPVKYAATEAVKDGFVVGKQAVTLAELGLRYEAEYAPRDSAFSDSKGLFSLQRRSGAVLKATQGVETNAILTALKEECEGGARIQVLVHPCHWLPLVCGNRAIAQRVTRRYVASRERGGEAS
jgi:hypothetical protein